MAKIPRTRFLHLLTSSLRSLRLGEEKMKK